MQFVGKGSFFYFFQIVGLCFIAVFCQRFGEISEQYGDLQLIVNGCVKQCIVGYCIVCYCDVNIGGQQIVDLDDKYYWIVLLCLWV